MNTKILCFLILSLIPLQNCCAAVNNMSIVPLFDTNQPVQACGQDSALALTYKEESLPEGAVRPIKPNLAYFLVSWNMTMPQVCKDNPGASWSMCAQYFTLASQAYDKYLTPLKLHQYPSFYIMSIAFTDSTIDPISYSKAVGVTLTPCSSTSPVPYIRPGTGVPNVTLENRGPSTHSLYNVKPVVKWTSLKVNGQIFGDAMSPGELLISVSGHPTNIANVYLVVQDSTGQTGYIQINENQKRMNPETGTEGFVAKINVTDWTAGPVTVRAIVVPEIGRVVQLSGLMDSLAKIRAGDHELKFYNNRNNAIVQRTYHIAANGVNSATCGNVSNPCLTMTGATLRHRESYGGDFSGVTLKFGAGTFEFGSTLSWPGPQTPNGPLTIAGTVSGGEKKTVFNRSVNLGSIGFPGQSFIGTNNLLIKDVALIPDITAPLPVNPIIGGVGNSNAFHSVILKNIFFDGTTRDPDNCLNYYPVGGTTHTIIDSYFTNFRGNGNHQNALRSVINKTSSIAHSNSRLLLNVMASVNHAVTHCNGPIETPHGDLVKSDKELLLDGFWTPLDDTIVSQGLFIPSHYDNNGILIIEDANVVVRNGHFRVGAPGTTGIGASLLMGAVNNIYVENSSFDGGPRRYQPFELGLPNFEYQNVYFDSSFDTGSLPSLDNIYTQTTMPVNPFESPQTSVVYSN